MHTNTHTQQSYIPPQPFDPGIKELPRLDESDKDSCQRAQRIPNVRGQDISDVLKRGPLPLKQNDNRVRGYVPRVSPIVELAEINVDIKLGDIGL